jgi:hypothetical protein
MKHWRKAIPVLISAGLLAFVVYRVSPHELGRAAAVVHWGWLVPLTAGLVLGLYFWDAVCLRWLFARPDAPLPYRAALYARGTSYLASAVNYEMGQGMLAWYLSRKQGMTLLAALSRCVLLAVHDVAVLLALGLIGALLSTDQRALVIRLVCGLGLSGLLALLLLAPNLPQRWRAAWLTSRWGAALDDWDRRRTFHLFLLRGVYYAIILGYAVASLPFCGVYLDPLVTFSVVPLVLLADGLPISISGLGTRETALLLLLQPEQPARIIAFSLFWSTGLLTGRALLGLGHYWLPQSWAARLGLLPADERKTDDLPGNGGDRLRGQPPR